MLINPEKLRRFCARLKQFNNEMISPTVNTNRVAVSVPAALMGSRPAGLVSEE